MQSWRCCMQENTKQYNHIFRLKNMMLIKEKKSPDSSVSRYRSSGELVFYWDISLFTHTHTHVYIYMCVCVCVCACVCVCVWLGSISSLRHIWLNNIDDFCLHIFVLIRSNWFMDVIISSRNWLKKFPWLICSQVLLDSSSAIIRGVYIAKVIQPLLVHYNFVRIKGYFIYTGVIL